MCGPCQNQHVRGLPESLDVLREREFRLLWLGRSLSAIGDSLMPVTTAFAVLAIGDASDLGIVLGAALGGRLVFTLAGGVWADRLPRRLIMIASDAVRAAAQIVVALVFLTDVVEVWHLAVAATIFGIAGAFFGPASTGVVPQVVTRAGSRRRTRSLASPATRPSCSAPCSPGCSSRRSATRSSTRSTQRASLQASRASR